MHTPDWRHIHYLFEGSPKQQAAAEALRVSKILEVLAEFDPALVSTICVGLDTDESDLDVICEVRDPTRLMKTVYENARFFPELKIDRSENAFIIQTRAGEFKVEIFAAPLPTPQQNAYRHLTIAWRLLELGGEPLRETVQQLRAQKRKPEAAFAEVLGLTGDPYQALLELEGLSDEELRSMINDR